ncbi:AfsR/SARP family transcriptional regulator [Virgisporangium ochraceum]|uniref:SARP family transcriptional regulator n=1 Tax=Virgisporangium ochraceum TaxID=65505 RepID=A0A8J4EEZ1_9ACTN|nr:BTAD domain-containing putative transcriptional regulator [Virgisporangium ochraceum]GIJ72221.1 SARP family transcriptional regulator [Virgisporangium ochraceum]
MDDGDGWRLRVSLLGPVRASRGTAECALGRPQRRAVLAVLALAAGQPVSRDDLVNALWPETPPPRAANVIQTHVKHLRHVLEPGRPSRAASAVLPAVGSGYALRVAPSEVDALRFRDLVAAARAARRTGDTARVWQVARTAIDMWSTPVADVPAMAAHPRVAALVTDWQLLLGWYAEIATAWGRADEVVSVLEEQARLRPLDEPVQALLLRAYVALGRRAGAFAVYTEARRRLAAELGVDPGPDLRSAYEELLRNDSAPVKAAGKTGPAAARPVAPAQLAARPHDFVGRDTELARLDLATTGTGPAGVVTIVGPPGVGKTALGLTWAHRAADRFPDGQLHVDLRGAGTDAPLHPDVVLERFLRALGVAPQEQPEELAARFRTHLANRRVIVFLDNAASVEQVEPLLPGQGGSVAVVTSRRRMDGLVALHGATRISLGPLPHRDALDLLLRLTDARSGSDTGMLTELARLCDRLPLAMRIACSRLDPAAGFAVPELTAAMADECTRLDELATESGEISVRAVYATAIGALDPASQRVLRLLSGHPGPRPSLAAAAVLCDLPVRAAKPVLARLVAAHLLVAVGPDRYGMHDLVRLIAREEADRAVPAAERDDATRRLLTWYRDTADSADSRLRPGERPNFTAPPRADVFPDRSSAFAWLDEEAANLAAAVEYAAGPHPRAAWQIAAAMFGWLTRRHHRSQWAALYTLAADAAGRAGDRAGEALIAGRLAAAHSQLGRTDDAIVACRRAYRIRRDLGDRLGAATALLNLGAVHLDRREPERAVGWLRRAAAELDDPAAGAGHFRMLLHSNLGQAYRLTRSFAAAARHLDDALTLGLDAGKHRDSAHVLLELSRLRLDTGDSPGALAYAHRALDHAERASDAFVRAEAQECLGRALLVQGDAGAARGPLVAALTAYDSMGHRDADELRALVNATG